MGMGFKTIEELLEFLDSRRTYFEEKHNIKCDPVKIVYDDLETMKFAVRRCANGQTGLIIIYGTPSGWYFLFPTKSQANTLINAFPEYYKKVEREEL